MAHHRAADVGGIRLAGLARRIPRARLATVPVGHLLHTAAPAAFTREVPAFLRSARTD